VSEIMKQHQRQQQQQQQQGNTGQSHAQQLDFTPDLAIVYASCNYGPQLQDVVKAVRRAVPSVKHIFGCSVSGVVGLRLHWMLVYLQLQHASQQQHAGISEL